MNNRSHLFIAITLSSIFVLPSCKKLVEVEPPVNRYVSGEVFNNTSTAVSAMTGIYVLLSREFEGGFVGEQAPSIIGALLSDELKPVGGGGLREYQNALNGQEGIHLRIWNAYYRNVIVRINGIIEGVSASTGIPPNEKSILLGEAKFLRGLIYFYLVNYYGDVPLILKTNFNDNSKVSRISKTEVYAQIVADLEEAKRSLNHNYLNADLISISIERLRPNSMAARALLARVYLYLENWQGAEQEATEVISDVTRYELVSLSTAFQKGSRETIWQLQPSEEYPGDGTNTPDARLFMNSWGSPPKYIVSEFLISEFEPGDLRKQHWITEYESFGSFYTIPYKYKIGAGDASQPQEEFNIVLRLSEQFLIRAEARAHQERITGVNSAEADLNIVRQRAGLSEAMASNKLDMLALIWHERYVELFSEMSHRWFDLKRTGALNLRMGLVAPQKGGDWNPYKALLPIPYDEFKLNPSLVGHQNPGYREIP